MGIRHHHKIFLELDEKVLDFCGGLWYKGLIGGGMGCGLDE